MTQSKWNNVKSIRIETIDESELHEAIHEWAEGCIELEKFLWLCYQNNVVTTGCHADEHYGDFYVSFDVEASNRTMLEKLIFFAYQLENLHVYIKFVGNPNSGDGWNRPSLLISSAFPCNAAKYLLRLSKVFEPDFKYDTDNPCLKILELYDLFNRRWLCLPIRLKVYRQDESTLFIENGMFKSTNNIIQKVMLGAGFRENDDPIHQEWISASTSPTQLGMDLQKLIDAFSKKFESEYIISPDDDNLRSWYVLFLEHRIVARQMNGDKS